MNLDASTITAVLGGIGVIIASVSGIVVATSNKKTEKEDSAKKALEETRDEAYEARLEVLAEKNAYLERQLLDCKTDNALHIEDLTLENDRLRTERDKLRDDKEKGV